MGEVRAGIDLLDRQLVALMAVRQGYIGAAARIKARLGKLTPGPVGSLPILVGGSGEKVTLRLVAEHADAWNSFGPPESWAAKNAILDEWCEKVGRDPKAVERTVCISADEVDSAEAYAEVGAEHVIVMSGDPFDLDALARLKDALSS